jgi:TPR repeat protein
LLAAIDHALEFAEKDRPQTIAEWRQELVGEQAVSTPAAAAPAPVRPATRATQVTTRSEAPAVPPAANVEARPVTAAGSHVVPTEVKRTSGSPAPRLAVAVVLGLLVLAAGIAMYRVFTERTNEAHSKIAALEKQLLDKDLAAAASQRAAEQKLEEEARQRREQERQAQEKRQTEAAAKPGLGERNAAERAAPASPRAAEKKRPDEPARSPPPSAKAAPATVPTAPSAQAPVPMTAVAPLPDVVAQPAAPVPEPAKPATEKSPADPLVEADRAIEARRFADALAILRPLADTGNARAQARLGDAYMQGQGIPRDDAAAGRWYERAALQGDPGAQVKLAAMYVNGNGVLRNNNLAYVWYGTAARLGSGTAKLEQEKIGPLLQPAERAQADKLIESAAARMAKRP